MDTVVQTCTSLQLRQLKTLQSQLCLSGERCQGTVPSFVKNLTRHTATPCPVAANAMLVVGFCGVWPCPRKTWDLRVFRLQTAGTDWVCGWSRGT